MTASIIFMEKDKNGKFSGKFLVGPALSLQYGPRWVRCPNRATRVQVEYNIFFFFLFS
jgi:hypothetical protein